MKPPSSTNTESLGQSNTYLSSDELFEPLHRHSSTQNTSNCGETRVIPEVRGRRERGKGKERE
uniref:Uncharacterized protein n=1 Tax=Anguilla anguilla TaxID=7936 RepID=A0A0E9PJ21_ANGAN